MPSRVTLGEHATGDDMPPTSDLTFPCRRVGRTDLHVSEVGFGAAALGGLFAEVPEKQGRDTLRAALSAGIGYVDTAPFYGYGKSEHVVGDVLREAIAPAVLSTKVGRLLIPSPGAIADQDGYARPLPFQPRYDYSYAGIMRSVADSQQRLGLSHIDILYVHDIGTMNHGRDGNARHWQDLAHGGYRALRELKSSGAVHAIGLGVNEWPVLMAALALGEWDVFLLAGRYTLLDQTALAPLMEACAARGTSIVIGGVFNSGALLGTGRWNYAAAPAEILARVRDFTAFCDDRGVPIGAAAMQMPLAHPAVCSVLASGRSTSELTQNLDWARTPIAEDFWADLAASGLLREGTLLPQSQVAL